MPRGRIAGLLPLASLALLAVVPTAAAETRGALPDLVVKKVPKPARRLRPPLRGQLHRGDLTVVPASVGSIHLETRARALNAPEVLVNAGIFP